MLKFKWENEFKNTELGKIPKDWEIRKVDEIGDIGGGSTPPTKVNDYWNGCIAWITPKDLAQHRYRFIKYGERNITKKAIREKSLRIYPPGTLLLTSRAPIGYIAIANNNVTTNQGFKNIVPREGVNSEFLYYLFSSIIEYLRDISGGSTFGELTKEILKNVVIPFPHYSEQSRIATVLSWFDDLIENKKRQNEILEKTAAAIFKNWFIDFEPFKEKEFVYNEEVGRKIPKGWEVKSIGEVAEFVNGFSYRGSEKFSEPVDGGYVFVTLNNVKEGGGFKTEYAWIKSERLKERHFLKEGDLIFANTEQTKSGRLLGTPAFVVFPPNYERDVGIYSCDTTRIIPNSPYLKFYLYLVMLLNQKQIAQSYHTGTSIWHFARKQFMENYHILFPPQGINRSFHSLVEPLFQKILLNQKQIMVLRKIRDVLLPKLVFGKLRVEEI